MRLIVLICLASATCSLATMSISATVIPAKGMHPIQVSSPMFPVNSQQCQAFAEEAAQWHQKLADWHDECLDSNRGKSMRFQKKGMQCSKPACEGLHNARDSFGKQVTEETSSCFKLVSSIRTQMASAMGSKIERTAIQSALLSGPYGGVLMVLKDKLSSMFAGALVSRAKLKATADFAQSAVELWQPVQDARDACMRKLPQSASINCEKQVLLSVYDLGNIPIDPESGDPVIKLFQRTMMEQLAFQNRDSFRRLQRSFTEEVDEGDSGQSLGH